MKALVSCPAFLLCVISASALIGRDAPVAIAAQATAARQQRVVSVAAGGDAAAAVTAARCGDVIELAAGQSYQALTLPPMTCGQWTTVRVAGALPERRIGPADARQLASVPRLNIPDGTSYWRIVGLRCAPTMNTYGCIRLGNADGHKDIASIAHHIELDRVFVDVPDAVQERRGIQVNASDVTIRRSTVHGVKENGEDSQAIGSWDSPGRVAIDDNDLQAAGEVIMFGGATPSLPGLFAQDVTITNNDISRPMAWRGGPYQIKNLLEIKAGRQFIIRGNRFSNNWVAAQSGLSILFTVRNERPWTTVEDILFEGNTLRNASGGINVLAVDNETPIEGRHPYPAQRITVRNNLLVLDPKTLGGDGRCYMLLLAPKDITIDHNTCVSDGSAVLVVDGPRASGFVFTNNLHNHGQYGIIGTGHGPGADSIAAFFDRPIILRNVFAGAAIPYPATNLTPSLSSFLGHFLSPSTGDYRLKETSSFRKAGTDGKDLGADVSALPK